MKLELQRTREALIGSLIGMLLGLLAAVSAMYSSVWIVIAVSVAFVAVVFMLQLQGWLTFTNGCAFLLGLSVFPQAVWSKGVHVSISDLALIAMSLWLVLTREIRIPGKYFRFVMLYLVYIIFSFTWSTHWSDGIVPFAQLVEYLIVSVLVFYNLDSLSDIERTAKMYLLFASAIGLLAIVLGGLHEFSGPLFVLGLHKNALGQIVGDALPINLALIFLAWNKKRKSSLYYVAFLVNLFALLLSLSRGAMMGAVVGMLIVVFLSGVLKRPLAFFVAIFSFAVIGFAINWYIANNPKLVAELLNIKVGSSAYTRIIMWDDVVSKIRQAPYFGHGLGTYFISIPEMGFKQQDPNNIFLLNWHDLGLVGLVLFALIILYLFLIGMTSFMTQVNSTLRLLHVAMFASFLSQLIHWQVDVSWVRGASLFFGATIGMMLRIRTIQEETKLQFYSGHRVE
jgi:O-antigen ligase